MTAKMQSCIDHIKTSTDVDPWAMEMVEKIFEEYDRRFDEVLEIIDAEAWSYCDYIIKHKNGNFYMHTAASNLSNNIRDAVLALKGEE